MTLPRTTDFSNGTKNLLALLSSKIEEYLSNNKSVCVCSMNSLMSFKNKINIDEYELDEDHLLLNHNNCEIHIKFNDSTSLTYENFEGCFTITNNDTEINLCFF